MEEFEAPEATESPKSGALLVVSIIAIVLGALGLCSGGGGLFSGALGAAYEALMDAAYPGQILAFALSAVNLVVSIALLAGGIIAIQSKYRSTKILLLALVGCVVHDVFKAILTVLNFFLTKDAATAYMEAMVKIPGANDFPVQGIATASMGVGLVTAFVWIAICMAYYAWGLMTLKSAVGVEAD